LPPAGAPFGFGLSPAFRASTTAPAMAARSTSEVISNGSRLRVNSAVPMSSGLPKPAGMRAGREMI